MRIIRAPQPTPAKPLPDVSWTIQKGEDGYPATLKAVAVPATPTPTPSAANATQQYAEDIPALDEHGNLKMTYRLLGVC